MILQNSAQEMSRTYALYLFAQLAGDEVESVDYGLWLDAHWQETDALPDEPCLADADSIHGTGGAVAWQEHDGAIIGLLAGRRRGCYRIPLEQRPPAIALMLDDATGCSTGSMFQERAHDEFQPVDVVTSSVIAPRRTTERPASGLELPHVPLPDPATGIGSELGM